MWNCVCIHPISIRLRCEFVLEITLCTQGTASDTRCESSSRRHNAKACIPGATVLVKFRQPCFRIRRIAATSARRRRLGRARPGTRPIASVSHLVSCASTQSQNIPEWRYFLDIQGDRQLAARTRAACVRAIYSGGLLNSAVPNRAQNFKQFAAWHADSSYKAREICTSFLYWERT